MARSMPFEGSHGPLQIFQDEDYENGPPMTSHAPMLPVTKPNRRPLGNANSNVLLQPPSFPGVSYSPHKPRSSSAQRSPLKQHEKRLDSVSIGPPANKGSITDSLHKRPPLSNFKTGPQKSSKSVSGSHPKGNMHPQIYPAPPTMSINIENFYPLPNGKRGLDANDSRPAKKAKMDDEPLALPPHDSFPPIMDDGGKPPHSYAQLIGMAILRSPMRRLTLAQIYKWISDAFSFYNPNDAGWQNSIRHNLSLHKNFIKIERPKDDPGKGNYWGIEPGTEAQFLKEKPTRKSAPTAENLPVMSTRMEPSRPATAPTPIHQEPVLPPPAPMSSSELPSTQPAVIELSSDATIPISDAATEEFVDKPAGNEAPLDSALYSPLPAAMHSSPPVARHIEPRAGTPPPMARKPMSSITRSYNKRKFASMDDSGYISSLESSAMRPTEKSSLLTSEADRPIQRGCAEEEIARIRNSSPFSPTQSRSRRTYGPISSSPLRQAHDSQMLPPLTPIVKMRPIIRPPPSASPNTNLRNHRDKVQNMLQSPLRTVSGVMDDVVPWSPAFKLDDAAYAMDDIGANTDEFSIFQDLPNLDDSLFGSMNPLDTGSPIKRSTKRKALDRSTSTSALREITNSAARRSVTSAPLLKLPDNSPMSFLETPSKAFEGLSSPSKAFTNSPLKSRSSAKTRDLAEIPEPEGWAAFDMDPTDFLSARVAEAGSNDFGAFDNGLDMLRGFQRIGSGQHSIEPPRFGKPTLGRSYSANP